MGRKSLKDDRQKEIIAAFYQVAQKEGLENASFAKIARLLDMPPSLLVHYFNTKEELLLSLIDFIVDQYQSIYQLRTKSKAAALDKLIAILDNIFSRRWDELIDDGVFYSCFALVFRDQRIRLKFKEMTLLLRQWLAEAIQACVDEQMLEVEDVEQTADLIFVISDGAYYFLSMIDDRQEYEEKLTTYHQQALRLLNLQQVSSAK
ncbi:MAG: TetR family transcriptional regulator [Cyclobacteriaceae bacterium]